MIPPVVKTLHVDLSPEDAFRRFAEEIGAWWPRESHSVAAGSGEVSEAVELDGRVGGRLIETLPG